MRSSRIPAATFLGLYIGLAGAAVAGMPGLPSETPDSFTAKTESFDYSRRIVDIPMRDGVKLHTVIVVPRGAKRAPILLTRTPYGAEARGGDQPSAHLAGLIGVSDVADELVTDAEYIRVLQDVRGKHGSEGDYVMTRPLIGPLNASTVDHSTDTYDTIDWLVKNIPESNGRVGMLGISYDGFTSLMALVHPHPALKAAVPINAMVDGWMGDDWFHHGAFRQDSLAYAHDQEATRKSSERWWTDHYDSYEDWLAAGSAGSMAKAHGLERIGFVQKLLAHPAYDAFWQEQALDKILAREPLQVPVMLVHSLWDQEDIYGNIAVYKAIKPKDVDGSKVFLVLGPWFHHQQRLDGSAVGPIRFGSDTAEYFRRNILRPFLDHQLKDDPPPMTVAPVNAFETGTNRWQPLKRWPSGCDEGCAPQARAVYLLPHGHLSLLAPINAAQPFDEYVSDPAKPIPFLPRPIHLAGEEGAHAWQTWLVSDQREAASRPDVLSFVTQPLEEPVKVSGEPIAKLLATTTGTDVDFVVKLIDVYPDEVGREPALGGYQLMVSGDILRGRYRKSYSEPSPVPVNSKQRYEFALPTVNHVFRRGHRIMVQVQSSWFPLYDRNPQKYVDNIFLAQSEDYVRSTIRIIEGADASQVVLPLVPLNAKVSVTGPLRAGGS